MSSYIQRSTNSGSLELIAVIPDGTTTYDDTTIDVSNYYLYRIVSGSNDVTTSISTVRYAPLQYYTGSIRTISLKYIDSTVLNTSGFDIQTSASYTASFSGSMSGWITGIPSQSLDQYKIRFGVVTDVNYVTTTSSLYTETIVTSQSYATDYSNSFAGRVTSTLVGSRDDFYVQPSLFTDNYYPTNNTTSLTYADIEFSASYGYTSLGNISGSIKNLQSGSYSDYWMYLYRAVEEDMLYPFPIGSASIDVNGHWNLTSNNNGHIIAKMYPKNVIDISKPAAIAGYSAHGTFFNAGVDGWYASSTSSATDTNGFSQDLGRIQGFTGTKIGRLIRKSDGRIMGTSDNPIPYTGSWVITDSSNNPKVFRLYSGSTAIPSFGEPDTASYIVEKAGNLGTGLLNSYWTPAGEILSNRCFTYDQGVAIIAFANNNDFYNANRLVEGALIALTGSKSGSFALSGSQWSFSVNALNGVYIDPYYRNGAQFWVASGLSHFVEIYPTASNVPQITSSLKMFWKTMFDYYWCGPSGSGLWPITGSAADYVASEGGDGDSGYIQNTQSYSGSGLQFNTFLGGVGVYHIPDYIFTASYVIPWSSCEHNTDAWFALRSSARIISDWSSSLAASASLLGYSLANSFWFDSGSQLRQQTVNTQSRGFQGLTNPYRPDDAHALDVGSWYGMFLRAYGEMGKFSASMATLAEYYLLDPGGSGASGYTPYLARYPDYASASSTVWIEGTAGAILAWRAASSHSFANEIYKGLAPIFTSSFGFKYATVPDPVYEIGSSGSATANTWMMIAENPNGFWEIDF